MIGSILHDRWRILAELGKGGMGEVFLAEHLVLGRKEALKILMTQVAQDPQFVSRFRREARAVNRLRHPNIVALYDFGQLPDGRFYLSMEYADGIGLNQLLRQSAPLELTRALNLVGQLAYALHHAHTRGVMHRDLKPGNLIVVDEDETEMLKVLDFGMAKIVASEYAESVALSTGNVIWGTAKYMSPERITGTGNDPRTDIYAIGCIACELVTGKPPFTGAANDMLQAHVTMPPPVPSTRRPDLPKELDAVILRCLEKKPDDRFHSAADLWAALHKVPGYPAQRTEARRRYVPQERLPSPTSFVQPAADDGELRGALRTVAEALLDLGLDDTRLVSGVAYLRDHERALARLEAAQDALEHEASAVRETALDREASLRFAIGELEFAAAQADATEPQDASRIRELEARLRATGEDADRLKTIDHGLHQVSAMRAEGLEKLKTAYDALEHVVDELLPSQVRRPELDLHVRRLAAVRARRTGR